MGTNSSLSDPDVSSSEQSIDTVIYVPDNKLHRQAKMGSPSVCRRSVSPRCSVRPAEKSHAQQHSSPYDVLGTQ